MTFVKKQLYQQLQWTTIIDGQEVKIYINIFPSFVIKYNKISADTIEHISKNNRKGEDIFTARSIGANHRLSLSN